MINKQKAHTRNKREGDLTSKNARGESAGAQKIDAKIYIGNKEEPNCMSTHALPKQMTIQQTSLLFSMPVWTLRSYISKNIIPYRKVRRRIYIPTEKFVNWLSRFDVEVFDEKSSKSKEVGEKQDD